MQRATVFVFYSKSPVFAIRQSINDHFPGQQGELQLAGRLESAVGRKPRRVRQAVARLTRQQLTGLINACPEIDDADTTALFEQYRYGSNPSFYIYLFAPARLALERMSDFADRMSRELEAASTQSSAEGDGAASPRRAIWLNDFGPLPSVDGIYEGTYRFLSPLNYIDAAENAISTEETLYGFFWISTRDGYVTIHARSPEVLNSLWSSIEKAAGVTLTHLKIKKQVKNALRFLDPEQFRSSRLYEPDPASVRFRVLTIADRNAYRKGYAQFENTYPEVRRASYRVSVSGKETTLAVTCDRGALSLAGHLQASEFRSWAVESLGEVIRVVQDLRSTPAKYIDTHDLQGDPCLAAYAGPERKALVLELLAKVLTIKGAGMEAETLSRPATELATLFGRDWAAVVTCTCTEPGCGEESPYVCPVCGGSLFTLLQTSDGLQLACQAQPEHWRTKLPIEKDLECGHSCRIDAMQLRDSLDLLPQSRLLGDMAGLAQRLSLEFDGEKEGFYVRGSEICYYANRDTWLAALPKNGGKGINSYNVYQYVQNNSGLMKGIEQNLKAPGIG